MPKDLNYNTDTIKHFVRYNGWVRPFKTIVNFIDNEIKKDRRSQKCKYFTFCAAQAVDVFMFEYFKYLHRNAETMRLENVYFCENEEESFSIIQKLIGSAEQGFFGDFKKVMLQNENQFISNSADPFDEPETSENREVLRMIELKKAIKQKFPFDVINLDFYGNFYPAGESRYSDAFQTYQQILELQKLSSEHELKRFLMYLTVYTPVYNEKRFVNPIVIQHFDGVLLQNLTYEGFEGSVRKKFGHIEIKKFEVYLRFIFGFLKSTVLKESYKFGWSPKVHSIMTYDRRHSDGRLHKETTFVVEYFRDTSLDGFRDFDGQKFKKAEDDYLNQIVELLAVAPQQVPSVLDIPKDVTKNLSDVIAFRNKFLKQIGIYDPSIFD